MENLKKLGIKGFRKKRIWPSVLLFCFYIVFCVLMITAFFGMFVTYVFDSKMEGINQDAEHLGKLIQAGSGQDDILERVRRVDGYLDKAADLCVTDKDFNVVLQLRNEELPDFRNESMRILDLLNKYKVIPAADVNWIDWENNELEVDIHDIGGKALKPPKRGLPKGESWMGETILSAGFWVEIPAGEKDYHLYYKDYAVLVRKDVIYILGMAIVGLGIFLVPAVLLFINLLSSIFMQRRMTKMLYLDTVTGGYNWLHFKWRSRKILCQHRNAHNTYAVVNLHMDRYQDYCACYGSGDGEKLLKNINGFLQAKIGKEETFARFAVADFGLLLRCDSLEACKRRLRKMLAELTGIRGNQKSNYRVGICPIQPMENNGKHTCKQRRNMDIDQLYHYANAARESGGGMEGQCIQVFGERILEEQLWKRKVVDAMEEALANREFQIYLQPKYNPVTDKIVGAEALVRWISPKDGMIPPGRFIPIFEDNGFITRLDDYMISGVAKLQSERKLQGKKAIPISVNVSRANFTKKDLAQHICRLVDEYGTDHACIELEVTESAFFGDKDMLQNIIKELKSYGFAISMDDFGAGYSSLNSLKDLPIDVLKLDTEFFRGDNADRRGKIVVQKAIQLAKNLDMKIVAEGIERKEQVDFLAEEGCDMIQGFYYAKPMPVHEFDEKIERQG